MLWIALHLPALPLESFSTTLPEAARALPVALLDGAGRAVDAANPAALALGVKPGVRRATALALAPQLIHHRRGPDDAAREAQALMAVAHVALAFTPAVTLPVVSAQQQSLDGPRAGHAVLLDVQASLRHFGGPERSLPRLLRQLQAALAPLGHSVQSASAPTALGAALLVRSVNGTGDNGDTGGSGRHGTRRPGPVNPGPAGVRHGSDVADPLEPAAGPAGHFEHVAHCADRMALQRRLDTVPVGLLDSAREHRDILRGIGLYTLADLRRLPRGGLARRFGEPLLDELDRALGRRPDPRDWLTLPNAFEARLELFALADTTEQVLYGAGLLLAQLVAWARAQQARVSRFTLLMRHERRRRRDVDVPESSTLDIALAEPSCDAEHLHVLLRERLAHLQLAAPTLELRLHCADIARGGPPTAELFASAGSEREGLLRLVERLQARLGRDRVQRLQPLADHRPERAVAVCTADARAVGCTAAQAPMEANRPVLPPQLPGRPAVPSQPPGRPAMQPQPPAVVPSNASRAPAGPSETPGRMTTMPSKSTRQPAPRSKPRHPPTVSAFAAEADPLPAKKPLAPKTLPPTPNTPTPRPVWLLREPQPLPERGSRPSLDGRPLQLLCGPERIEAGWWDAAGLAERDYFIAQAADGALVWVYRARLPLRLLAVEPSAAEGQPDELQEQSQGWFLQGRFA